MALPALDEIAILYTPEAAPIPVASLEAALLSSVLEAAFPACLFCARATAQRCLRRKCATLHGFDSSALGAWSSSFLVRLLACTARFQASLQWSRREQRWCTHASHSSATHAQVSRMSTPSHSGSTALASSRISMQPGHSSAFSSPPSGATLSETAALSELEQLLESSMLVGPDEWHRTTSHDPSLALASLESASDVQTTTRSASLLGVLAGRTTSPAS
eukprot:CAMPEP_0179185470 /NCGR_PEP_ID=MMETSP0796-20121207/91969_1 /TAXON_ID=73915 /ORGANISM="Pyrodinium bahamense, Strain pbaha01" /LENGTH=218 /DNA_ID=CAMNT_0020889427 /DNA_START=2157 /DNA_END=2812 /DNA_ORIENTATION=+